MSSFAGYVASNKGGLGCTLLAVALSVVFGPEYDSEISHVILDAHPQLIFSAAPSQPLYPRPVDRSLGFQAGKFAVMGSSAQISRRGRGPRR